MYLTQLDRRPLYVQVHDRLLAFIQESGMEPGERLPSESTLADQLGVSRATLREALRLLEEEGVIVRRHGVGTFVAANRHLESGLERLESVLALAGRQGMETRMEDLEVRIVRADRSVAERLGTDPGVSLTYVSRTILVEDQPVAYLEDLVLTDWLSPDHLNAEFSGSVLDLLRGLYPQRVQEALAEITAVRAGRSLARRLGVSPGAALLLLEETLFDTTGAPVGFSRNYFVPERFRFHVVRR
ncbi:MAG TPA: GntR family transcriptional regulator [Thermoflexia bacterium]|jgi:GntR family transcriptional regulator|nr:GntR family transcriptional regulator [Thermoflexia bacterium]